jgi:hypothetical protein
VRYGYGRATQEQWIGNRRRIVHAQYELIILIIHEYRETERYPLEHSFLLASSQLFTQARQLFPLVNTQTGGVQYSVPTRETEPTCT